MERQLLELGRDADDRSVSERADRRRPGPRYRHGDVAREGTPRRHGRHRHLSEPPPARGGREYDARAGRNAGGLGLVHDAHPGPRQQDAVYPRIGHGQPQRRRSYTLRPGGTARCGLDHRLRGQRPRGRVRLGEPARAKLPRILIGVEARRPDPTVRPGFAHRRVRLFERSEHASRRRACSGLVRSSSVR